MRTYDRLRDGLKYLHTADTRAARCNSIPVTKNTGEKHWWAICALSRELVNQGCYIVVEARFPKCGRADIYLPELKTVIEVLHSETIGEYVKKKRKYVEHYPAVRMGYVTTDELGTLDAATAVQVALKRGDEVEENDTL